MGRVQVENCRDEKMQQTGPPFRVHELEVKSEAEEVKKQGNPQPDRESQLQQPALVLFREWPVGRANVARNEKERACLSFSQYAVLTELSFLSLPL